MKMAVLSTSSLLVRQENVPDIKGLRVYEGEREPFSELQFLSFNN